MSVALWISRLPSTTRWPWLAYRLAAEVRLVHRRAGLLDLQEQRIRLVRALQQHQVHPHADAADADDLADGVDEREAVEQVAAVVGQRVAGSAAKTCLLERRLVVDDADRHRRVLGDPQVPVDGLGELPRPHRGCVRRLRLAARCGGRRCSCSAPARSTSSSSVDVDQVVPDVELRATRVARRSAVR